jgi:hypothetical protein
MLSQKEVSKIEDDLRNVKTPYDKTVFKEENGQVTVDWAKIVEMQRTMREGTYSAQLLHGTYDHLIDLGILSVQPEGNYQLSGEGVILNPRSHVFPLYFVRENDAKDYKNLMFSKTQYPIHISKVL